MSFICIVCREILTKKPWQEVDDDYDSLEGSAGVRAGAVQQQVHVHVDIVSTKCGHLYHLDCLKDWFNKQVNPRQECPYCKSVVLTDDYQRVFPIGDEETDDIDARLKKAKSMVQESAILKSEIDQFKFLLEEAGEQSEDLILALDILQYEYREKCLEKDGLKAELDGAKKVMKRQWTEDLRKLEEEKIVVELKLAEEKENLLKVQVECDQLRKAKTDTENGSTTLVKNIHLDHISFLDEIRVMQQNFQSSLMQSSGTGAPKSSHSMASQTDGSLSTGPLLASLSRLEMHDLCIRFLESEKKLLQAQNVMVEQSHSEIIPETSTSQVFSSINSISSTSGIAQCITTD